jgi:hypothetical protein
VVAPQVVFRSLWNLNLMGESLEGWGAWRDRFAPFFFVPFQFLNKKSHWGFPMAFLFFGYLFSLLLWAAGDAVH